MTDSRVPSVPFDRVCGRAHEARTQVERRWTTVDSRPRGQPGGRGDRNRAGWKDDRSPLSPPKGMFRVKNWVHAAAPAKNTMMAPPMAPVVGLIGARTL